LSGAYCAWQRPPTTCPTTFHVWKTRGCQCSFRLTMMGGVSPETCWASDKYGIIKILIDCCILLDFLYEANTTSLRIIIHFLWSILQCSQYLWLHNISCRKTDKLCMIWNKWMWPNPDTILTYAWREWGKPWKTSFLTLILHQHLFHLT